MTNPNIYRILTAKPAKEGSTCRAGVTKADLERPSIRQPDTDRFARSRPYQSLLSCEVGTSGQMFGLHRHAELSSKIKLTRMASSKLLFTATKGDEVTRRHECEWLPVITTPHLSCKVFDENWVYQSLKCFGLLCFKTQTI